MENASKALLMAGSVLIAVIVIGLFLMAFNSIREVPKAQEEKLQAEQLAKFNAEYEAYEKDKMYGTDVITVMKKAIDNNNLYLDYEEMYDVDIEFTLASSIKASRLDYYVDNDGFQTYDIIDKGKAKDKYGNEIELGEIFKADKIYSVLDKPYKEGTKTNEDIYKLLNELEPRITIPGKDEFHYSIIDSGFTDFKRKMFKCTGIEYNVYTGRVNKLSFAEIEEIE